MPDCTLFVEELTVTARRREEYIQDVPLAVTMLTASQLESSFTRDLAEITGYSPNVIIDPVRAGPSATAISIRGISFQDIEKSFDPAVGVFIDEDESVWVISARLNRLLKYNTQGELQYYLGAFGGTRGGFAGGLSRPHQMDVDQDGNLYIASWDGGWMDKFVPRPNADPDKLVGRPLVLER